MRSNSLSYLLIQLFYDAGLDPPPFLRRSAERQLGPSQLGRRPKFVLNTTTSKVPDFRFRQVVASPTYARVQYDVFSVRKLSSESSRTALRAYTLIISIHSETVKGAI